MCGIVGYYNANTTLDDLIVLERVLIESKIRGMHASGLAWYNGKRIKHLVQSVPIDRLLAGFDLASTLFYDSCISIIGHARYSTSDLEYNQPLIGNNVAISHNGIISQRHPKYWMGDHGYKCEGRNDSELLLRALDNGDDPLLAFPKASIAAVVINSEGKVTALRNGLRPLWTGKIGKGRVFASTFDILHRSGVGNIRKVTAKPESQRRDSSG